MAKIDYAFKALVLQEYDDILTAERRSSKSQYCRLYRPDVSLPQNIYGAAEQVVLSFLNGGEENRKILQECAKINHAGFERKVRLERRISEMLNGGTSFFLTLTFSDETLNVTSEKTRRKYVTLFLKSLARHYVANVDYGKENGREHYHAVIQADDVCMDLWNKYGFSNAQRIRSEEDATAIAKYVSKLTNHAIKDTTKGARMIYSKD